MTTALAVITKALQKNGVLTKSETPSSDEASDGLYALNSLLSSWSNETLSVYSRVRESFTLSGGTASYTIGTGQTFNTTRPISIVDAFIRQDTTDYPLSISSDSVYNAIVNKSTQGTPEILNFSNGYPTTTIYLWPVPSTAFTLHITSEKELTQLTLSGTISLPAGWERALIYNLAVELAPEYGVEVSQITYQIAKESKAAIMRTVNKIRTMDAGPSGGASMYNILSDR